MGSPQVTSCPTPTYPEAGLTQHRQEEGHLLWKRRQWAGLWKSGFSWDQPWPCKKSHALTLRDLLGHAEFLLRGLDLVAQVGHLQVGGRKPFLQGLHLWGLQLVRKNREEVVTVADVVKTVRATVCLMYVPGAGQGLESSEIPGPWDAKLRWVGGKASEA